MTFSVGLPQMVCLFVCDFIALQIMESKLAFHNDNFWKFHVPYAWRIRSTDQRAICDWKKKKKKKAET